MERKEIEKEEFLALCAREDQEMLLGKRRMPFRDFERLTFLTNFFGYIYYNLELWNSYAQDYSREYENLIRLAEEAVPDEAWRDDEENEQEQWVLQFCENVPDEEKREQLKKRIHEICKEQGIEPCGQAETS